jgi:N-ethylmaleimide reductase
MTAGFDGVEVHAANGYLIDQFLRDRTNKRTDQYGGSIENRTRFLMEVTDAVVSVAGRGRVGVRISPQNTQNDIDDSDPQVLFSHVAKGLAERQIAYLHVIDGDTSGKPVPAFDCAALTRLFGGPVISNNNFDRARAMAAVAERRADMVAFGKPFISNPDLVIRLLLGAPLEMANRETFYGGGEEGYTDYQLLRSVKPDVCYRDYERAWG